MDKQSILRFAQSIIIIPFLTTTIPLASIGKDKVVPPVAMTIEEKILNERAEKIDRYFRDRNMPLHGYGKKMVIESDKNSLDWRLLPAIAVRESTGGKYACGNNPFGWGSCKIKFDSVEESIEILAWNLSGKNPNTTSYYETESVYKKLHRYNGTVVPSYPEEVITIMRRIDKEPVNSDDSPKNKS